jgi:hypothetical protein
MEVQSIESYKFYSEQSIQLLKKALVNLQQQYEQVQKDQRKKQQLTKTTHFSTNYKEFGRDGGGSDHSYFSDDDDSDRSSNDDDDDSDVDDENDKNHNDRNDSNHNIQCNSATTTATTATGSKMENNHRFANKKATKKKKKKSTQEYLKQMGKPPSETLITDVQHDTNTAYALTIPTVLFPSNEGTGSGDGGGRRDCDLAYFYQSQEEGMKNKDHLEPIFSLYNLANELATTMSTDTTNIMDAKRSSTGTSSNCSNVLVILLQSGRFAAAIFNKENCIKHTTFNRYTVRKGQGGSQSSLDNAKGKAKSVGSQLRRAGEAQLRNDVYTTLLSWKTDIHNCSLIFLSLSKMLQKGFWQDVDKVFGSTTGTAGYNGLKDNMGFRKGSDQVKSIPLDVGRPCYESCCAVYDLLMTCSLLSVNLSMREDDGYECDDNNVNMIMNGQNEMQSSSLYPIEEDTRQQNDTINDNNIPTRMEIPLTPLHEAARDGNIEKLSSLLSSCTVNETHDDIDAIAGPKLMTPLHYAVLASSSSSTNNNNNDDTNNVDHAIAAKCIGLLLTRGHANPCIPDAHHRPPYFLAPNDTIRNAFRKARSELGEEIWNWDDGAKVGPALTEDDIKNKRDKAAEKKKRQRMRQKEKKALEKQQAAEEERLKREEEEKKQNEENARRVRAGLKPKAASDGGLVCDFCQKDCKGKRKSQLFTRLEFLYCSSDCMKRHQRELMAAAATARMKGN